MKYIKSVLFAFAFFMGASALNAAPAQKGVGGGFDLSGKQPINIESERLEVNDKHNSAVFSGRVIAIQGDTTLKCEKLEVYYDQADGKKPAQDQQDKQNRSINRLEAFTNVVFVSKDQTATGQRGTYDAKKNLVTIWGGVTLTQGDNVVTGEKMVLDTTTNIAKVETSKGGRVRALFVPGTDKEKEDHKKKR